MKLKKLLAATEALKRLTEKRFSNYKTVRDLVNLRKAVDAEVDIYLEQERKAIQTYAVLDERGNPVLLSDGIVRLKTEQAKLDFDKELTELRESEVDGIETVVLHEGDFRTTDDIPTPDDILVLEPIVKFE